MGDTDTQSGPCDIKAVLEEENKYIHRRQNALKDSLRDLKDPNFSLPVDLLDSKRVGLALSGGGIRSATTNLGILQALANLRLLPMVDYLCTVSGGGYIGGCLSSLLSLNENNKREKWDCYELDEKGTPALFDTIRKFPLSDERAPSSQFGGAAQVAHLRTHGNFLIARSGLFARDTLRAIGNLLTGVTFPVTFVSLTLVFIASLIMLLATYFTGGLADVKPDSWNQIGDLVKSFWIPENVFTFVIMTSVLFTIVVFGFMLRWQSCESQGAVAGDSEEDKNERTGLLYVGIALFIVVVVVSWCVKHWSTGAETTKLQDLLRLLFLPAFFLAVTLTVSLVIAWLLPLAASLLKQPSWWTRKSRSCWGAYQSITLYGLGAAFLFGILPIAAHVLTDYSMSTAVGAIISFAAARAFAPRLNGERRKHHLPQALVRPLLGLAVCLFLLFVVLLWSIALVNVDHRLWVAGGIFGLLVGAGVVVNLNKVSLHYFYGDRLAETYLRTETPVKPYESDLESGPLKIRRDSIQMFLKDLHGEGQSPHTTAPYHLISAAINLAGSRDLTRKDRKSGFFLFSKYFCGSKWTKYRRTGDYRHGQTTLSQALTISGAAVGPGVGYHTFFAQAFAATLFNLRLGYWMDNPKKQSHRDDEEPIFWGWFKFKEPLIFWPWFMFKEMFARTDAKGRLVNLSDGGHTGDNVGIYPLFQRKCSVIIACDAEADENLSFDSFTRALRYAYVDLGVIVDINLDMIRPDPATGKSRSHCAVGRIRYRKDSNSPYAFEDSENWLIYIKNSLTGNEPSPVQNYKQDHGAFPHETTCDQFFDDDQFESYRALGFHMATYTFEPWLKAAQRDRKKACWRGLARQHTPYSAASAEKFLEMSKKYTEIEKLFATDDSLSTYAGELAGLTQPATTHSVPMVNATRIATVCAMQIQLMEDVYFALRLDLYPNAPDNGGWMNLFRAWGRNSPQFKRHFERLKANHAPAFVRFCEDYIIGCKSIDELPVPHPWDPEEARSHSDGHKVEGVYLDPGNAP